MLKIYRAYALQGEIKIEDYIKFNNGQFNSGSEGFGEVNSGNIACQIANYSLEGLEEFRKYLLSLSQEDGWVKNFTILKPYSYKMLEEQFGNVHKDFDSYQEHGLIEEAVLLFTEYVNLIYPQNNYVERIFGRHYNTGLYLLKPNASFYMATDLNPKGIVNENYEVLQSQNLGNRLILQKMDRKI